MEFSSLWLVENLFPERQEAPPLKPTRENLTAILSCLGARATPEVQEYVLALQNPYRQKRGGLGFGAYSQVRIPGSESSFTNINLFNQGRQQSPLEICIDDTQRGTFVLKSDEATFAEGRLLPIPTWGKKTVSTGKPAITVLQQHGPRNLVGVLGPEGTTRCPLFDVRKACSFCMMDGGGSNQKRTAEEVTEAFALAFEDRSSYNLTLSTPFIDEAAMPSLINDVAQVKKGMGCASLAIEIQPIEKRWIRGLKDAGVDTLMLPLDCADPDAQRKYVPGKMQLLGKKYWVKVM
jgi:hypothetical protein